MINLFQEIKKKKLEKKIALKINNKTITYLKLYKDIENLKKKLSKKNKIQIVNTLNIYDFICKFYAISSLQKIIIPINFNNKLRKKSISKQLKINKKVKRNTFLIIFSSGTTQKFSKGVLLSQKNLSFVCKNMNSQIQNNKEINEMVVGSLEHAFALGRMHALLSSGNTLTISSDSNVYKNLLEFNDRKCNSLSIISGFVSKFIHFNFFRKIINQSKYIQLGSMKLPISYRKKILRLNKKIQIVINYGLTEVMRATFLNLRKNPKKINTEGKPFKGVSIKIIDKEKNFCKINETGNIYLKGESLALGYLNKKEWKKKFFKGWFNTEDLGYLDKDGFLVYKSRKNSILNIYGNSIIAEEIEEKLNISLNLNFIIIQIDYHKKGLENPIYLIVEGNLKPNKKKIFKILSNLEPQVIPNKIINMKSFPRTFNFKINRNLVKDIIQKKLLNKS